MRGSLYQFRYWSLDHRKEDIRGWNLRDLDGHDLGRVNDLIIDTDLRCVTQLVLEDGRTIDAHDVVIGKHVLYIDESMRTAK